MKKLASFLTVLSLYFVASTSINAQYGPYQPPTTTLSILVNKLVANPVVLTDGTIRLDYVDNLGTGDHRFKAGEDVWFQVKVKNTSNTILTNVTVKDFLPPYIETVEGPGSFDSGSNTITINAGDFAVNEEKVYVFKMRVKSQNNLPDNVTCVTNKSQAFNDKVSDDDTAQLCIEKPVLGVATTPTPVTITVNKIPSTGPEYGLLLYTLSGLAGLAGLKLRRSK